MSGPKISVYSLTGWAKRVVDGQTECEQQAMVCAQQIRTILAACSSMGIELDRSLSMLGILQQRYGGQDAMIAEIKDLKVSMNREMKKVQEELGQDPPSISPKYTISETALEEKRRKLEKIRAIKNKAQALKDRLDKAAKAGKDAGKAEQRKAHQEIAEYLTDGDTDEPDTPEIEDIANVMSSISSDISGVFSFDEIGDVDEKSSFEERKVALRKELTALQKMDLSDGLAAEIKNATSRLENIKNIESLRTFDSITVKKIFNDLEAFQEKCEKEKAEFEELLIRYQTLCDMSGKTDERERKFEEAGELKEAVHELEILAVRQKEQAYIAECVDEVMQEMGYDLIGKREVRKKSGKQFRNELYQFNEGTAVNITYSPEGQISMELGGIAREDRIPTEEETSVLTQDMETFCGEFAEFEKRMKEKGIIVGNRVALMPPSAEYAAIINVNDYEIEQGRQVSEINTAMKHKKPAQAQKALRRDD